MVRFAITNDNFNAPFIKFCICKNQEEYMKYKYIVLTICIMCMLFMFCNVHADPNPTDGKAYAVLTDEGELILFRSETEYSDGVGQTVTDIMGNTYTGQIWGSIETTNETDSSNSKWSGQKGSVESVRVASGQTIKPVNCCYWFSGCDACASMNLTGLDTTNVENMRNMFSGCSSLESLNLGGFNTSNVTNMSYMFNGCSTLTALDLSNFSTSNVTSMQNMFSGCSDLTNLTVNSFDTRNVTSMSSMFEGCSNLSNLI